MVKKTPPVQDLFAIGALLVASLILIAPVLGRGIVAYMDNPCHLAEVHSLARAMGGEGVWGWCDDAFCGFPLITFQSPLWYGLLGLVAYLGIAPLAPYTLLVWLGFVAPALALYRVARRSLEPFAAGLLAFLLLIQPPALGGIESAPGGMWPWHLGLAGVILLCGQLAAPVRGGRHVARVAVLVGLIGLTHLMALAAAGFLFAANAFLRLASRGGRDLARDTAGVLLGLVASAGFWLTFVMGADGWGALRPDESPAFLLGLLALPWNVLTRRPESLLFYTDAIPMLTALLLGLWACVHAVRGWRSTAPEMAVGARGGALALLVLLAVPLMPVDALGPLGWRFVHVARIGLLMAAVPLVAMWVARWNPSRNLRAGVAVLAVVSCVWWGRPLAQRVPSPDAPAMAMVENLWAWLADNAPRDGSRVIVQDTFDARPSSPLYSGHVMALTGVRAGVPPAGAW
jgi:hypothetical protein